MPAGAMAFTALGAYMHAALGRNPDPAAPKPPKDMSLADAVKDGYKAIERMGQEIHRLYHPKGCKCAMCEIKADDETQETAIPAGALCHDPCFGCTVLTCPTHPDRKPEGARKTVGEALGIRTPPLKQMREDVSKLSLPEEPNGPGWNYGAAHDEKKQLITAIKNLEAQLWTLSKNYQEVLAERDQLQKERGLQSAGMHIGGKPLYMVTDGPYRGPLKAEFIRDPKETDRQAMQRLAQVCRDEGVTREREIRQLEHHQKLHPGFMITEFGVGPVRFQCEKEGGCDL